MTHQKQYISVYLSLGSSIGEKQKTLEKAFEEIKKWGITPRISSFHESEPWGGVAQNTFVNAACFLQTTLSPEELLEKIHETEKKFMRTRKITWEDRTLDIDILLYGDQIINTDTLIIPHKYMLERDFVINPLQEIMPKKDFEKLQHKK